MDVRTTPISIATEGLERLARDENFPVASRLLPARQREHLLAIYGIARLVDDTGDESAGDRLAELDALEAELDRAFAGTATHPVFVRLQPTIRECRLDRQPFAALIEANRRDQTVTRFATWDDLLGYCALSANPVGRLVLAVFDASTPQRIGWSDDVCTALQVVEHLQDVGEDARRDRVYLPQDVLARHGCADADLLATTASPALRAVIAELGERSHRLLASGAPLASSLHGRPRWAVAGFTAGGLAALDAIVAAGNDVLSEPVRPHRARVVHHTVAIASGRRGRPRSTIDAAYAHCWEVTSAQARNFAYGIGLLPPPKRKAMAALYALARRIDDIGDGADTPDVKLQRLETVRTDLRTLRRDARAVAHDPVFAALAHAATRFPIPLGAFDDLIEGCEQDSVGTTYKTIDDVVRYCRLVAGSIGRLSLGVFGAADMAAASVLADDLGVALQLTNILRDVAEDRAMGRVYLPAADLDEFGCAPDASGPREAMGLLVRFECARARTWYGRGLALLPHLDHRSRACTAAMAGIYRGLLDRIERDPTAVLDRRLSLPTRHKLLVAAKAITVGSP